MVCGTDLQRLISDCLSTDLAVRQQYAGVFKVVNMYKVGMERQQTVAGSFMKVHQSR